MRQQRQAWQKRNSLLHFHSRKDWMSHRQSEVFEEGLLFFEKEKKRSIYDLTFFVWVVVFKKIFYCLLACIFGLCPSRDSLIFNNAGPRHAQYICSISYILQRFTQQWKSLLFFFKWNRYTCYAIIGQLHNNVVYYVLSIFLQGVTLWLSHLIQDTHSFNQDVQHFFVLIFFLPYARWRFVNQDFF